MAQLLVPRRVSLFGRHLFSVFRCWFSRVFLPDHSEKDIRGDLEGKGTVNRHEGPGVQRVLDRLQIDGSVRILDWTGNEVRWYGAALAEAPSLWRDNTLQTF